MAKLLVLIVILAGLHLFVLGAPGGRIIGGTDAEPGQFPYMVSLQIIEKNRESRHDCGGSIMTKRTILTAAHCLSDGYHYYAYVGANKLDGDGVFYEVEGFLVHPNYTVFEGDSEDSENAIIKHDIGVLYLKTDMEFSPLVQPIELDPEYIFGGESVIASGWGIMELESGDHVYPNELQYIKLRSIDQEVCNNLVTEFPLLPHFSHVCFLNRAGEGLCMADSGGPIVKNGKQIGVISWSVKYCAQGVPDGAARVSTDIEWIKSVTK